MTLRAQVDPDICISSGRCVADAPGAFAFDDDEIAGAIDGAASLEREALLTIARNCPAEAIRVYDGDRRMELY